jgi:hypothetical protein
MKVIEKQYVFDTMQKAILMDNYNLKCEHCPYSPIVKGNCRAKFCGEIISSLRRELERCQKKEKEK